MNYDEYIKYAGIRPAFVREEWKHINAYDIISDRYMISNFGNIYDNYNNMPCNTYIRSGYVAAKLQTYDNGYKVFDIHRIILMTFTPIDNPENFVVNHIDGDRLNNCIHNLEWTTQHDNLMHAIALGLTPVGTDRSYVYMTDDQIHFICKSLEECKTYDYIITELMKQGDYEYDKLRGLISNIKQHKTFLNISSQYNIDNKHRNSTYSVEFIHTLCKYMQQGYTFEQLVQVMNIPEDRKKAFRITVREILSGIKYKNITSQYNLQRPSDIPSVTNCYYTDEQVIDICNMINNNVPIDEIVSKFVDISTLTRAQLLAWRKTIYCIKSKRTFKHITEKYIND